MDVTGVKFLFPELLLSLVAIVALVGDTMKPHWRRLWINLSCLSVLAAMLFLVKCIPAPAPVVMGMAVVDGFARYFKLVILLGLLLVLWMSEGYKEFEKHLGVEGQRNPAAAAGWGTYCSLLLFGTVGLLLLSSATDFILIVIAIELVGISTFILAGFLRGERRSAEAAIKFFLVGAFSTGLLIYGISLLYGMLGTTQVDALWKVDFTQTPKLPYVGAVLFVIAGFGFKAALAPFHMWVPDTYEGAPTPVTAYISVAPKAGALAIFLRTLSQHAALDLSTLIAVLALATMTIGNLAALSQTNIKRLLGYSSIAQMGYAMIGFVAAGQAGTSAVLVFILSYVVMNLGAFACVIMVTNQAETDELDAFNGLSQRSLPMALVTSAFMLSLTGLPPMIGFIGKFTIFASAVSSGWLWLAVGGVLNSVISFYYYFGFVYRMFFKKSADASAAPLAASPFLTSCVCVTLLVTVLAGLFPQTILLWVRQVVP